MYSLLLLRETTEHLMYWWG